MRKSAAAQVAHTSPAVVHPVETRHDIGRRLATQRMRSFNRYARLITNLRNYDLTADEREAVITAVFTAADAIKVALDKPRNGGADRDLFSFK